MSVNVGTKLFTLPSVYNISILSQNATPQVHILTCFNNTSTKQLEFLITTLYSSNESEWPIQAVVMRRLPYWDCGFESRRGRGCLTVVNVVCENRGLCDRPFPRPEESYWQWCVVECDWAQQKTLTHKLISCSPLNLLKYALCSQSQKGPCFRIQSFAHMAMTYHFTNISILQNLVVTLKVFETYENCNIQGTSLYRRLSYFV